MKDIELLKLLNEKDFHMDPLGRLVIDNPEILNAINGAAMNVMRGDEMGVNGGCSNSGCG